MAWLEESGMVSVACGGGGKARQGIGGGAQREGPHRWRRLVGQCLQIAERIVLIEGDPIGQSEGAAAER